MYHYKSAYIQKGHGLGGLFRGIRKFFTPLARKVVTTLNKPEVKNVLKTLGKETVTTGSELLLDSLQGNDIQATLNRRINKAKKRIAESIEDGIKSRQKVNNIKRYRNLGDESLDSNSYEYFSSHNKHNKNRSPSIKKKPTPSTKVGRLANRQLTPRRINKLVRRHHKTVFD